MRIVMIAILFVIACKNESNVSGSDLMPEMAETDSLELLFFRSPDSPRYFSYLPTTDKELINALVKDVSGKIQPENQCMKEGKIYCFKKGEIFNTIFFAYTDPGCNVLRYIKNGKLYYFPLGATVKKKLEAYKVAAREPSAVSANLLSKNK
jgi:uncharacterized ParB-like nuclease family protein